jgi:hypothetical protein
VYCVAGSRNGNGCRLLGGSRDGGKQAGAGQQDSAIAGVQDHLVFSPPGPERRGEMLRWLGLFLRCRCNTET